MSSLNLVMTCTCSKLKGFSLLVASNCAAFRMFLICLPLSSICARVSICSSVNSPFSVERPKNATYTCFRASKVNLPYCNDRWMRLSNAASMFSTRLLVRKRKPSKYSRMRRKMETSLLRSRSLVERASRKTSASSRRSTAFHFVVMERICFRVCSTLSGFVSMWPADIMYSGTFMASATASAVRVLSTPGGPL
jgi:hypothetical protein